MKKFVELDHIRCSDPATFFRELAELGGIKSLYSDSYFTSEEFWEVYNKPAYDKLKAKYDPKDRLSDLYRKLPSWW